MIDHEQNNIESIKVFVAMPGTDFGKNAFYDTPEEVHDNLLVPVCEKVASMLHIDPSIVKLKIEKDKTKGGDIYKSMYREAVEADVYIADLTGANPNVYLELGVRWAFRESVTIPIVQNQSDLRFNVSKARVLQYTPKTIQKDVKNIAETIVNGLKEKHPDSPILSSTDLVWMSRREREELERQVQAARGSEVEELLARAKGLRDLSEKIAILKTVLAKVPTSYQAAQRLGVAYREFGDYAASEGALIHALEINPTDPVTQRELGVTLSKAGRYNEAIEYLRTAGRLNDKDAEVFNNLGGALRRAAESSEPDGWNIRHLKEAYNCYENALRINKFDIYAALNIARTGLILSCWEEGYLESAKCIFEQQIYLAHYITSLEPDNVWRWLDLADCYLFTGNFEQAEAKIHSALERVQPDAHQDIMKSYTGPFKILLSLDVLDSKTREFVEILLGRILINK